MMEPKISAILMAAGLSRRMGEDKLLLRYRGETLLQRAVNLLLELPVYERILVTKEELLFGLVLPPKVRVVINRCPEEGQSESMRLGVLAAAGDWYFFMVADQPKLTPSDLMPLLGCAKGNRIIYPDINGKPCTPVLFSAGFCAELLVVHGDKGGRAVRAAHPEACLPIRINNPGNFMDIDDENDYRALLSG
jgi:molybdenum cofactor cytidylyltransferase